MNVVFVSYYDFRSPSGMHIFHLANALAKQGVRCVAYSNGDASTVLRYGQPRFRSYDRTMAPHRLAAEVNFKPNDTIVHCWTPRERARVSAGQVADTFGAPLIVHMEDNEEAITKANLQRLSPEEIASGEEIWNPGNRMHGFSHPERHREFMESVQGYTCIIESLLDFKPAQVPGHVFWPSCEPEVFAVPPSSPEEKERWGIAPENHVIFYPGNMHRNNYQEVLHLYMAVSMLRKAGFPVSIIKFGNYAVDLEDPIYAPLDLRSAVVDLTNIITPAQVPDVMRAADFLVQPGEDNEFNRYRFPCKLPLFLASGRPVIMPRSNLGTHVTDGKNCLLLQGEESSPEEIAGLLRTLIENPALAEEIGQGGRNFAREHFSWDVSAKGLSLFYKTILENHSSR